VFINNYHSKRPFECLKLSSLCASNSLHVNKIFYARYFGKSQLSAGSDSKSQKYIARNSKYVLHNIPRKYHDKMRSIVKIFIYIVVRSTYNIDIKKYVKPRMLCVNQISAAYSIHQNIIINV